MPISYGIIASQVSGHLVTDLGAMFPIQSYVATGSSGTITFSSIPATWNHLQIRGLVHSTRTAGTDAGFTMTVNSDAGANYSYHRLIGDGTSATANGTANASTFYNDDITADNGNSSTYTAFVIDILNYANTNMYKTIRSLHGFDKNGSGQIKLLSGSWRNTNAITSMTFVTDNFFKAGSSIALYGVKA